MQIDNRTPFSTQVIILPNFDGIDTLYTMVKATFKIGDKWVLDDEQPMPQAEDEYWGEPESSSLKYATDIHVGKPATDIAVVGSAYAPEGNPVGQLDVGVSVGNIQKVVRVFGNRQWINGLITRPEPFQEMPLIYENAFGGSYYVDGKLKSQEIRNPVGKGHKGKRSNGEMNGATLPNIEDPLQLIGTMLDTPEPACFGFRAPHWHPRLHYSGTYDDAWQTQRAPYLPQDFNAKFNQSAHPDLTYPGYMQGGEPVKIVNMSTQGALNFHMPSVKLAGRVRIIRKHDQRVGFNLESVVIEPEQGRLQLAWKSELVIDNLTGKVEKIEIALTR